MKKPRTWAFSNEILTALALSIVVGCSVFEKKEILGEALDSKTKLAQEEELSLAQTELDNMKFQKAHELFRKFQFSHLESPLVYRAKVGQARALEALGKWSEAAALYRETIESTRKYQPELAAFSLYQLSFCYEALGEETKVFASLKDAEALKQNLSIEISKAELPARLAASYYRMGRHKEAAQMLGEAEQGLGELKAARVKEASREWLARTYFQMGLISTNQLSIENFRPSLDTLKIVQIFSLRAAEEGDPKWSPLAAEVLSRTYKDLAVLVEQVPLNKSMERGLGLREQRQAKAQMAGQILESIERLSSLRATVENEDKIISNLYASLLPISKNLGENLLADPVQNELTPESQKFHKLKKNVIMQSAPVFPIEKAEERK